MITLNLFRDETISTLSSRCYHNADVVWVVYHRKQIHLVRRKKTVTLQSNTVKNRLRNIVAEWSDVTFGRRSWSDVTFRRRPWSDVTFRRRRSLVAVAVVGAGDQLVSGKWIDYFYFDDGKHRSIVRWGVLYREDWWAGKGGGLLNRKRGRGEGRQDIPERNICSILLFTYMYVRNVLVQFYVSCSGGFENINMCGQTLLRFSYSKH